MTLLKTFTSKQKEGLLAKEVKTTLNTLQLLIESIKAEFNLDKIYSSIGEELLKIEISTLFCLYDSRRNLLTIKHFFSAKENIALLNKISKEKEVQGESEPFWLVTWIRIKQTSVTSLKMLAVKWKLSSMDMKVYIYYCMNQLD